LAIAHSGVFQFWDSSALCNHRLRNWPSETYLREDHAVARVIEFLQTHLFGPGRRKGLARALEETDPERDGHHDEAERLKSELTELAARIRRQVSHLEALEADTDAGAESRSRLRELAALKARRERELQAAERAVAAKPDREQAQELVDLLPQLDVDAALLADESFREMLAALDFRATYEPDRSVLKVRATLALELLPVNGDGMSSLLSVHPTGQYSKKSPQVEGHVLRLSGRHAKLRRDGYRKRRDR
jgi:hypothetical protein